MYFETQNDCISQKNVVFYIETQWKEGYDMSEAFHIISDGSCDLPAELAQEKNITVVPFYVSFDDEHYLKENLDNDIRDF